MTGERLDACMDTRRAGAAGMKILLRVRGGRLTRRLVAELAASESAFPRQIGPGKRLCWQLEPIDSPLCADHLANTPSRVSVVLAEAGQGSTIDELWALGRREHALLCSRNERDVPPAPVILVFDREYPTSQLVEMPVLVTDWVSDEEAMHDLARRVIASLRRQRHLLEHLGGGLLALNPETRRLSFNETEVIQLSAAEVPLAELFLTHMGSVVPMEEICLLFRLAGRSTSGSNIRVTIFQLRFKIERVTHHQFSLVCAYGEGYALRAARGWGERNAGPRTEARQAPATYAA